MITRVRVAGMTCQHCINAVFTSLGAVEGVTRAEVSLGVVDVEHDGSVTVEAIGTAIAVAGYSVVSGESRRGGLPIL